MTCTIATLFRNVVVTVFLFVHSKRAPILIATVDVSNCRIHIELSGKAAQLLLTMQGVLAPGKLLWLQNFGLEKRLGHDFPFCLVSSEGAVLTKVQILSATGTLGAALWNDAMNLHEHRVQASPPTGPTQPSPSTSSVHQGAALPSHSILRSQELRLQTLY